MHKLNKQTFASAQFINITDDILLFFVIIIMMYIVYIIIIVFSRAQVQFRISPEHPLS